MNSDLILDDLINKSDRIIKKYTRIAAKYSNYELEDCRLGPRFQLASPLFEDGLTRYVIDIGCGSGGLSRRLAKKYPEIQFRGIDFTQKLIELGKAKCPTNVLLFYGNFLQPPKEIEDYLKTYKREVLYLVWGVLEHYHTHDPFTKNLNHWWGTVETGKFLFCCLNIDLLFGFRPHIKDKCYWTESEAISLFAKQGDQVVITYHTLAGTSLLAGKFRLLDNFLLACDSVVRLLPTTIQKLVMECFAITIIRK